MILKGCINKIVAVTVVLLVTTFSYGQITSGRIVFERKTNLKKKFADNPRFSRNITDENKIRIEHFELFFDDTSSVFLPIEEEDEASGMMGYMTTQNTIYQNLNNRNYYAIIDLWGTEAYLSDSMTIRDWKITENKRKLGGYMCRKAIWEPNDSTRIYAWFSADIVPSVGPEGFYGLPGAILGLATEDGGVIYFATEVEALKPKDGILKHEVKKKGVYNKVDLIDLLEEKMGQWVKRKDLEGMFSWF